jgi:hypothetical protein
LNLGGKCAGLIIDRVSQLVQSFVPAIACFLVCSLYIQLTPKGILIIEVSSSWDVIPSAQTQPE